MHSSNKNSRTTGGNFISGQVIKEEEETTKLD